MMLGHQDKAKMIAASRPTALLKDAFKKTCAQNRPTVNRQAGSPHRSNYLGESSNGPRPHRGVALARMGMMRAAERWQAKPDVEPPRKATRKYSIVRRRRLFLARKLGQNGGVSAKITIREISS